MAVSFTAFVHEVALGLEGIDEKKKIPQVSTVYRFLVRLLFLTTTRREPRTGRFQVGKTASYRFSSILFCHHSESLYFLLFFRKQMVGSGGGERIGNA